MTRRALAAALLAAGACLAGACAERADDAPRTDTPNDGGDAPAGAGQAGATLGVSLDGEPTATRTTALGVVVETFAAGGGEPAAPGDVVRIAFEARLPDGSVFQSSASRGAPLDVPLTLGRAVPGLIEGLAGLREGETARLAVPWRAAYGEAGRPPVPPRADLVFDVRVLSIDPGGAEPLPAE